MPRFSSASTAFELHHDLKPFSRLFPILLHLFRNTLQRGDIIRLPLRRTIVDPQNPAIRCPQRDGLRTVPEFGSPLPLSVGPKHKNTQR